jgi:hypothetical protein
MKLIQMQNNIVNVSMLTEKGWRQSEPEVATIQCLCKEKSKSEVAIDTKEDGRQDRV